MSGVREVHRRRASETDQSLNSAGVGSLPEKHRRGRPADETMLTMRLIVPAGTAAAGLMSAH